MEVTGTLDHIIYKFKIEVSSKSLLGVLNKMLYNHEKIHMELDDLKPEDECILIRVFPERDGDSGYLPDLVYIHQEIQNILVQSGFIKRTWK